MFSVAIFVVDKEPKRVPSRGECLNQNTSFHGVKMLPLKRMNLLARVSTILFIQKFKKYM